jgi:hypothetical protein
MRPGAGLVLALFLAAALGGPLLLGLAAFLRRRPRIRRTPWDLKLSLASALTYTLAFNLVFIGQELALVIPKALTPGLHPVLFHNNHTWTGDNPLARLFQGTGALADLLMALVALAWLALTRSRSASLRLFAIWVAYSGLFQSLPQAVAGAMLPGNDVGMAWDYLGLSPTAMRVAAALAVVAMAAAGLWLSRAMLALATPGARPMAFVLRTAVLPGLLGTLLVLPFRVPGAIDQVVVVPVAVAVLGLAWMQGGAWLWRVRPEPSDPPGLLVPLLANLAVLAVFQLALRPGVAF